LFGNADFVSKSGITFADYARNGFFELVWVLVLASLVILVVYRPLDINSFFSKPTLPQQKPGQLI
jgi:hypothetical protein